MKPLLAICLVWFLIGSAVQAGSPEEWTDANLDSLVKLYLDLHRHPEVSFQEKDTAARMASEFKAAGYEVTTNVGGNGVVAVLKNGDGPCVMLRTDLDALPVKENTGLEYASKVTVTNTDGSQAGVMHACGHDMHMTSLVGVARYLAANKDKWKGTLVLIGQPAEERSGGAAAMLKDGLFERFPKPDYVIALHVSADMAAGNVGIRPGYLMANVDSVDITMKGRGGHGSAPETTIDPIMQAAELVVALQTIVSREIRPQDPAVITVGSIHGGTKHNIIGDECKLQLTVRSYSDDVRQNLLDGIVRKAKAVAAGARAPEPMITFSDQTPAVYNNEDLTARLSPVMSRVVGEKHVEHVEPAMAGEDFAFFGKAGVPILMYRLGSVDQRRLDVFKAAGQNPPSLHSAQFYPEVEPTLKTGIATMTAVVLELLKK